MSINWNNLRSWNGSLTNSFEELCCQLAAEESVPNGSHFFRKGTPDAGVECFWRLPNGDEWAWQAKYFLSSPSTTQWREIVESVKNAIEKHPRLTKYTICLPVDRSDARVGRQKTFLMKWNDYIVKWQSLAVKKGMLVTFEFWGQSEIGGHLSDEKHRGRLWFWFSEECFSNSWFAKRVDEAIANARDRYSPDLNIDLPIRNNFDALGRTPEFFKWLEGLYSEAHIKFKKLRPAAEPKSLNEKYNHILKISHELFARIEPWVRQGKDYVEWTVTNPILWDDISLFASKLLDAISECISEIYELKKQLKKEKGKKLQTFSSNHDNQLFLLHEFQYSVLVIDKGLHTDKCKLSNLPAFLLVGRAGQGKTHLLCDVAKRETYESRPRLIFHGEQFRNEEPWLQMIHLLGLNCSREEFIGALVSAAQANKCRILIFIDALNEGEGNRLWFKFLPGILTILAQSQWLGICVSVRNSYEKHIIPDTLNESRIVRVEHIGFGDFAYDAAAKFFEHFGIEPSTPVLLPEFYNPLFLKLFCQSLFNAGITRVPSGLRGITAIFNFFIDSIDKKLSRPECLDYDVQSKVVAQAVVNLTKEMAKGKVDRLPVDEAKAMVNKLLPREGHQKSLFYHLESEGVLTVVPNYWKREDDELSETVRFTYQRFSDHLVTQRLLEQHLDKKKPKESFLKSRTLGRLIKDEDACYMNRGILEALAIQIPEFTKKELPDLAPHLATLHPMHEAFIDSIIWRDQDSFSRSTKRYINKHILAYSGMSDNFWNSIIILAITPNHPFNADCLHDILSGFNLPDRDAWWSIFLHHELGRQRTVDRLVEWAWKDNDKTSLEDEVIRLAGVTLAWFFTTPNRFLRDRATKAMVRLCEKRIHVLQQIIGKFLGVDDPYVTERLYAVAYGCATRTTDIDMLTNLARDVYRWVFESGKPLPHVLMRDYARGVIEVALHRGAKLDIDVAKVRPPYRSDWPSIDVPELDELKAWGKEKAGMPDKEMARVYLYGAVMGEGILEELYVLDSFNEWSSQRIGKAHKPTHKELHDQFVKNLTKRQREAWDTYCIVLQNINFSRITEPDLQEKYFKQKFSETVLDTALHTAEQHLVRTFRKGSKEYKLFHEVVAKYIAEPQKYYQENSFDRKLARRWIMKKIIDLGWTVERFGEFDRNVKCYTWYRQSANKSECIGRKYQWIAYHELHARLSDNFKMIEDKLDGRSTEYKGLWNIGVQYNIDSSNLLQKTQRENWRQHTNNWWFPIKFDSWEEPSDEVEWLKENKNLPCIQNIIEVTSPEDDSRWLTLNGFYQWEQSIPIGIDRYDVKRRDLWYMLKSYLVKKTHSTKLMSWAKKQTWMNRWMPESSASYEVLLGEFFWSPIFKDQDYCYYDYQGWTRGSGNKIPSEVLVTNDEYGRESGGLDGSIDDSISIDLPCSFLVDGMKLDWRGIEGYWYDDKGRLVALDPTVRYRGPQVLLFQRDMLIDFLERNELTLFWTLLGEKRMIGSMMSHEDYRGLLEINGAYILKNKAISGNTRSKYLAPGTIR